MRFKQSTFSVSTKGEQNLLITDLVERHCPFLKEFEQGMLHIFIRHTSASLTINENADPDVRSDLTAALDRIAPKSAPYKHDEEGPDDMPAHVKSSLIGSSVTIPIVSGRLGLGRWQGIYLCEHRSAPHTRELICSAWGE